MDEYDYSEDSSYDTHDNNYYSFDDSYQDSSEDSSDYDEICKKCESFDKMINSEYCINCNLCFICKNIKENINEKYCNKCNVKLLTCNFCHKNVEIVDNIYNTNTKVNINDILILCNSCKTCQLNMMNEVCRDIKKKKYYDIHISYVEKQAQDLLESSHIDLCVFKKSLKFLNDTHSKYIVANKLQHHIINKASFMIYYTSYLVSDNPFEFRWIISRLEHAVNILNIKEQKNISNIYNNNVICNRAFEKACNIIISLDYNVAKTFLMIAKIKHIASKELIYYIMFFATGYLHNKIAHLIQDRFPTQISNNILKYNNILQNYWKYKKN